MTSQLLPCCKELALFPIQRNEINACSQGPSLKQNAIKSSENTPSGSYINHLCQKGRLHDAVMALDSIANTNPKISHTIFINLLQSCINSNSLHLGRKIHKLLHIAEGRTLKLHNKLVGMYAKCGAISDARKVFDKMTERDLFSWSAIIGGYSRNRMWDEVIDMFYMMMETNVSPDAFILPKILQACGYTSDFSTGQLIHSMSLRCGFGDYPYVDNAVLSVYAKCGKMDMARKVFDTMRKRDTVAWNALISGYCGIGKVEEARDLVEKMYEQGCKPNQTTWNILIAGFFRNGDCDSAIELMDSMATRDVVTWTSIISGLSKNSKHTQALDYFCDMICTSVNPNFISIACALSCCTSLQAFLLGSQIHALGIKNELISNVLVGNALICMYSKRGDLESARRIFDGIESKDIYSWNSMISGYCDAGLCGQAFMLFTQMKNSEVTPNSVTWNTLISGYLHHKHEDQAAHLFDTMDHKDSASWNSLISGYVRIGWKNAAVDVFRQMISSKFTPNAVTLMSLLPACGNLLSFMRVKEIHGYTLRANLGNEVSVVNSLIETYGKTGNLAYARALFDREKSKDFITYHSLIAANVLHGCSDAALDLAEEMENLGLRPTSGSLAFLIIACGVSKKAEKGRSIFSLMKEQYQVTPGNDHYAAMVHAYGRCGMIDDAINVVDTIAISPNSSLWLALFTACRRCGESGTAIPVALKFLHRQPNDYSVRKFLALTCHSSAREKVLGQSRVIINSAVRSFTSSDRSSVDVSIMNWIESTERECGLPTRLFVDEEDDDGVHSEKLALACAFVDGACKPRCIRIVKNFRMCGDCHQIAKFVSQKYHCEIYLSDSVSFHHFKSGVCSCDDYW